MTRRSIAHRFALSSLLALVLVAPACGEDEVATSTARGVPGSLGGKKKDPTEEGAAKPRAKAATPAAGAAAEAEEEVDEGPPRPPIVLDEKSFSRRRDPFRNYVVSERVEPEPDAPRAERKVKLAQYSFEDLRLVAIVNSGRSIQPRALFLGSDGKSKGVMQGEYFSSAEVLLAAVNRDYVEIEVVDEELAAGLGLRRGERRAIYLRTE